MTPALPEVAFPELRSELQYALAALADEEYQSKVWVEGGVPKAPYAYDFDMACHAILDDTDVTRNPRSLLGTVLRNDRELESLVALADALAAVIRDIGANGTIQAARLSPGWRVVVNRAAESSRLIGMPAVFP